MKGRIVMADQQHRWTDVELKSLLELGPIASLENLIAQPGRKYRQEYAHEYAIGALRTIVESDVLPEDIQVLALRVLALHETASDPFLGMNLSTTEGQEQRQKRPRVDIEAADAEEQARQDWSNDE